jgi:hypothetical protein
MVEALSSPCPTPRITVVPCAMPPNSSARCAIDLSPGTSIAPRSGAAAGGTWIACAAPAAGAADVRFAARARSIRARVLAVAAGERALERVELGAHAGERAGHRRRVGEQDVAPHLGGARRDAGRAVERRSGEGERVRCGGAPRARGVGGAGQREGQQVRHVAGECE